MVLAFVGILLTVHLKMQETRGFDQGCWGFNPPAEGEQQFFDCEAVTGSAAGQLFGVSNAFWGMGFYALVALLSALIAFNGSPARERFKGARVGLLTIGVFYSAYLAWVQHTQIGEYCALCLTSAALVATLFLLQVLDLFLNMKPQDRTHALRPAFFGLLVGLTVILAGADIAYFNTLETPEPMMTQVDESELASMFNTNELEGLPSEPALNCYYDQDKPAAPNFKEWIAFDDASAGNPDASVTVLEYFDPNCPHCKTVGAEMTKVKKALKDEAYFVFKPIPLLGQKSVGQVAALHYANQKGKFFEMLDRQFDMQNPQGISFPQLRKMTNEAGLNATELESRLRANTYAGRMTSDYKQFVDHGYTSVPTVLINGKVVAGNSRSAECLAQLIRQAAAPAR